jgi:flagellar basal-body rod modification protein FlgD
MMSPTSSPTSSPGASDAGNSPAASGSTGNPTVSKNMFLQLLVAQIKNQDPLNPADSVQYLTQLAQFTQVEQTLTMSTDLAAIRADLDQLVTKSQTTTQT